MSKDNSLKDIKKQLDDLGVAYPKTATAIQLVTILTKELNKKNAEIQKQKDKPDQVNQASLQSEDQGQTDPDPSPSGQAPKPVGRGALQESSVTSVAEDTTGNIKDLNHLMNKDKAAMKKWIWEQPTVKFFIPLSPGEKPETAYETWMRNGYGLQIRKGILLDLPLPVMEDLANHYQVQVEAGSDMRLDRSEKVQDALG